MGHQGSWNGSRLRTQGAECLSGCGLLRTWGEWEWDGRAKNRNTVEVSRDNEGFPSGPRWDGLKYQGCVIDHIYGQIRGLCYSVLLTVQNMDQNQNGIQMWWHTAAIPELKETLARGPYIHHHCRLCIEILCKEVTKQTQPRMSDWNNVRLKIRREGIHRGRYMGPRTLGCWWENQWIVRDSVRRKNQGGEPQRQKPDLNAVGEDGGRRKVLFFRKVMWK